MGKEARTVKSKSRWMWVVGGVVIAAAFVLIGSGFFNSSNQTQVEPETAIAFTGDISGSVTGSGHLQARQDVSLSMMLAVGSAV